MMTYIISGYIIGAFVTAGVFGGVRERLPGCITDVVRIVFWPVVATVMIPYLFLKLCYHFGGLFKK